MPISSQDFAVTQAAALPDVRVSPSQPAERHPRYVELDSLRGLAASTVVLNHFLDVWATTWWYHYWKLTPLRVFTAGHEAVILFFLLSGFVLAVPFAKSGTIDYARFIVRRICRIYLPYLVALAVAVTGCWFLYSTTPTGNYFIDFTWAHRPTLKSIVAHVLMLGHYDTRTFNGAFWSLIDEMRISIVYPVIWILAVRWRPILLLPLTIFGTFCAAEAIRHFGHSPIFDTVMYAGLFVVGALLFRYLNQLVGWVKRLTPAQRLTFFIASVVCFEIWGATTPYILGYHRGLVYIRNWLTAAGGAGVILCALSYPPFQKLLHLPLVLRLGQISYSLYLIHVPVLYVLIRLFLGKIPFVTLLPLYLIAVYGLSRLMYHYVEKPSIELGRRICRSRLFAATPAVNAARQSSPAE